MYMRLGFARSMCTRTARRLCSTRQGGHNVHFRNTPNQHPLAVDKHWVNPTINHVWSEDEIETRLATQPRHKPVHLSEKLAHGFLQFAYKTFNTLTG